MGFFSSLFGVVFTQYTDVAILGGIRKTACLLPLSFTSRSHPTLSSTQFTGHHITIARHHLFLPLFPLPIPSIRSCSYPNIHALAHYSHNSSKGQGLKHVCYTKIEYMDICLMYIPYQHLWSLGSGLRGFLTRLRDIWWWRSTT